MALQNTDTQPWYKQRWPWLLMAGPATVVVAGIFTAWLAVKSNDGLVAEDYYKQGLAVNQQLQKERKAGELGLSGDLMRSGVALRVMLKGAPGMALPQKLTLRLAHPTRAGMDQSVELVAEGGGMFSGKLNADISGRWNAYLEDPSGQWRMQGEWQSDAVEPLRLVAGAIN